MSLPAVQALWLPYEVGDVDSAALFFGDHLGLSTVDEWERPSERGRVLKVAEAAFLELVSPGAGAPATVALEFASADAVDALHRRLDPAARPPGRFARGHYGFTAGTPVGRVMVWSER